MKVVTTKLPGVLILEPKVFQDHRGHFLELFQIDRYREAGLNVPFVQDNWSRSVKGTLRGLHFQHPRPQGKLVSVISGRVFDVVVDIRRSSKTFGQWLGVELNEENHRQVWVPPGFAHGFCVLSDVADVLYKCTDVYVPEFDLGLAWNDPSLGIEWPVSTPLLSEKDAAAPRLKDVARLPD